MQGRLVAVAAILILLFAGLGAVQTGYWNSAVASEEHIDFRQNFTVNEGATIAIENVSNRGVVYPREREINVTQNDTAFEPSGNWSWNRHNGTVKIDASSHFNDGADANVSGFYVHPSQAQNTTKNIALLPVGEASDAWLLAGMVVLIIAALGVATNRA